MKKIFFLLTIFLCICSNISFASAYITQILEAGQYDHFNPDIDSPPASPSLGLQLYTTDIFNAYLINRPFDSFTPDSYFSHTFKDFGVENKIIFDATLSLSLTPVTADTSIPHNDTISIGFIGGDAQQIAEGWERQIGTYEQNSDIVGLLSCNWGTAECEGKELTLFDLSALPLSDGITKNILDTLNTYHFMDLMIQDDTAIDYARLKVKYCNDNIPDISPKNVIVSPGSEITFNLLALGSDVNRITAAIQVDPNVMSFVEGNYGNFFNSDNILENQMGFDYENGIWTGDAKYQIPLKAIPSQPVEQEGDFASITFSVMSNTYGSYTIQCLNFTFLDDQNKILRGSNRFNASYHITIDDGIHGGKNTVSGKIFCPEGVPEDQIMVRIISNNGYAYSIESFAVDNEIHYKLPEIREGAFTLEAYAPGFISDPIDISLTELNTNLDENLYLWDKTRGLNIYGTGQILLNNETHSLPFSKRYPKGTLLKLKSVPVCDFVEYTGDIESNEVDQVIELNKTMSFTAKFDHPEFDLAMNIEGMDIGGVRFYDLQIGVASDPQYLDAALDPPQYSVKADLYTSSGEGPFSKIIYSQGERVYEWMVVINPHGNIEPPDEERKAIIRWNPDVFPENPCWYVRLREGSNGNGKIIIPDMRDVSEIEILGNDAFQVYTIEFVPYACMSLKKGWILTTLPVIPDSNALTALFHDVSVVYKFNNNYKLIDHMENSDGFWLKAPSDKTYNLYGPPLISYSKTLKEGWHLIGGCYYTSKARTDPPGKIKVIYGFNKKYIINDEHILERAQGYWVKVIEDCDFYVEPITLKSNIVSALSSLKYGKNFGYIAGKVPYNLCRSVYIVNENRLIKPIKTYYGYFATILPVGEYSFFCNSMNQTVYIDPFKVHQLFFDNQWNYY